MVEGLENHIRHKELGVHHSQQVIGVMLVYSSVNSFKCLEQVQNQTHFPSGRYQCPQPPPCCSFAHHQPSTAQQRNKLDLLLNGWTRLKHPKT